MKKIVWLVVTLVTMLTFFSFNAFAGQWMNENGEWWYKKSDGSYAISEWVIDNKKEYHINENGFMDHDTWIDGVYYVNESGVKQKDVNVPDGTYVNTYGYRFGYDKPIGKFTDVYECDNEGVHVIVHYRASSTGSKTKMEVRFNGFEIDGNKLYLDYSSTSGNGSYSSWTMHLIGKASVEAFISPTSNETKYLFKDVYKKLIINKSRANEKIELYTFGGEKSGIVDLYIEPNNNYFNTFK